MEKFPKYPKSLSEKLLRKMFSFRYTTGSDRSISPPEVTEIGVGSVTGSIVGSSANSNMGSTVISGVGTGVAAWGTNGTGVAPPPAGLQATQMRSIPPASNAANSFCLTLSPPSHDPNLQAVNLSSPHDVSPRNYNVVVYNTTFLIKMQRPIEV